MRIRTLALAAAVAALPFSLSACGGASVADFCEQYDAIDQIGQDDAGKVKGALEELSDVVPDEAGDDVQDAVDTLADTFPDDGDLEAAANDGDLTDDDAREIGEAGETISSYADENCEG
jgi:hypothetical protein